MTLLYILRTIVAGVLGWHVGTWIGEPGWIPTPRTGKFIIVFLIVYIFLLVTL